MDGFIIETRELLQSLKQLLGVLAGLRDGTTRLPIRSDQQEKHILLPGTFVSGKDANSAERQNPLYNAPADDENRLSIWINSGAFLLFRWACCFVSDPRSSRGLSKNSKRLRRRIATNASSLVLM